MSRYFNIQVENYTHFDFIFGGEYFDCGAWKSNNRKSTIGASLEKSVNQGVLHGTETREGEAELI